MKHCESCKVDIIGERRICPLCGQILVGEANGTKSVFPYVPSIQKQFGMLIKIITISAIVCCVIAVAINMMIPQSGWWSVFVVMGVICLFVSTTVAINKSSNPPKNIIYQATTVIISCVLWDLLTGWYGWSIDFILPLAAISAMLSLSVTAMVLKIPMEDTLLYLLIASFYGIIPIIFILTKSINVIYPSLICCALSIIYLATLIVFRGKHINSELEKRFHL